MGWRRRAGGGKRDSAEKGIVDALRAAGAKVFFVGGTGNPDILVRPRGFPKGFARGFEVKTGKGKLTKNQDSEDWPVVTTPEQALKEIGAV